MKINSLGSKMAAVLAVASIFISGCGDSSAQKVIGNWQDAAESTSSFVISKTESGLVLQAAGESATLAVAIKGNALTVGDTTLTFDEQKNELSMLGLFNQQIVFKKINGDQK